MNNFDLIAQGRKISLDTHAVYSVDYKTEQYSYMAHNILSVYAAG